MVNTLNHQKQKILTLLRQNPKGISGEQLGNHLKISRVAIHKHIQGIKKSGYQVDSGHFGYRIDETGSYPFTNWEFQNSENIRILEVVNSTMDEAHRHVMNHPGKNFVIAALRQENGRGRRQRTWESPEGGLWATRVIHPGATALNLQRWIMAATVGLARHLKKAHGLQAGVKWPNDVYINKRKVAGILGEARISGDRIHYLALGLGLNVNNSVINEATALCDLSGREEDRRSLLRGWIGESDALCSSEEFFNNEDWWHEMMLHQGEKAKFIVNEMIIEAVVLGVDRLGRLKIEVNDREERCLSSGEVDFGEW